MGYIESSNRVLGHVDAAFVKPRAAMRDECNTVHLRPVRPELVEGPSYAARLRQAQPERIKSAK